MNIYPYKAERFLREAQEALVRMDKAADGDELKRALITFLNAARHMTQQLQAEFKSNLPGFCEWWNEKGRVLETDAIAKFFRDMRNDVTKAGKDDAYLSIRWQIAGPVTLQGPLEISADGTVLVLDAGEKRPRLEPLKGIPGHRIISWDFLKKPKRYENVRGRDLMTLYMRCLNDIIDEFSQKFGQVG